MFHLRAKIIGRSSGRSAAGAAAYRVGSRRGAAAMAYRTGEKLRDPNTGQVFDYAAKARVDSDGFGILHTEVLLPHGAPAWMLDRQALIDAVEASEKRKDAQLFREIELSLPRELALDEQVELVKAFARSAFVSQGMVADIAIHDERASDGGRNPHAHILLTMREVNSEGFGRKVRAWNNPALLKEWRETWAEMANEKLAELGFERRLDHRSHKDRGIGTEPDIYVGPRAKRGFEGVMAAARAEQRSDVREENIRRINGNPEILLDGITREKATFTEADIAYALRRATGLAAGDERYDELLAAVKVAPGLVPIASDQRGVTRFSTRDMIECEMKMAAAAARLAHRNTSKVNQAPLAHGLSAEQEQAYAHVVAGPDLTMVSGVAGAGKTTTLKAITEALHEGGHRLRGVALAAIAAKKLGDETGIPTSTLAGLFYKWDNQNEYGRPAPYPRPTWAAPTMAGLPSVRTTPHPSALERGDVLIVDEAGMVDSRDMRRLLQEADRAGARVVLVGDAKQLQAIGAGAPFRALCDTHGAAELQEARRQQTDWMREATVAMRAGRMGEALERYRRAGAVHASTTTTEAMDALIARWMQDRANGHSQFILSHYTVDVEALNTRAREALRRHGKLGPDIRVQVQKQVRDENGVIQQRAGYRTFAEGDRILFTRNDKALGVQNGALGDVVCLDESGAFEVRLDDGKTIAFSASEYGHITKGYATTVHKSQSLTVDRAYVLATDRFSAQLAYVALSRHRQAVNLYYGRDQFENEGDLERACSRERVKDCTLDYLDAYLGTRSAARTQSGEQQATPPKVMTPAERVRANAARRRARGRERTRERGWGD